jgi:hypothetical protein
MQLPMQANVVLAPPSYSAEFIIPVVPYSESYSEYPAMMYSPEYAPYDQASAEWAAMAAAQQQQHQQQQYEAHGGGAGFGQ